MTDATLRCGHCETTFEDVDAMLACVRDHEPIQVDTGVAR